MPLEFTYKTKKYRWYAGLKREKKREMIRVFEELKQKGYFLGFQQLRDKMQLLQPIPENFNILIRPREQIISDLEFQLVKTFKAILNQKKINWNPYHISRPYIPLYNENAGIPTEGITSDIEFLEVFQWDERSGPNRLGSYPSSKKTPLKDMMQIYANHIAEKESGFLALSNPERTLMSYYAGPATRLFLIAQIKGVQDVVHYESKMEAVMNKIVILIPSGDDANPDQVATKLEGFYHEFSPQKTIPIAEILKEIANHKILKLICSKLQQDGRISSDILKDWLKIPLQKGLINLDKDLKPLFEIGLFDRRFVGDSVNIGLIKDFTPILAPPFVFLKNLPNITIDLQLKTVYLKQIGEKMQGRMNESGNMELATNLLTKANILKLLDYLKSNYLQAGHYSHLTALGIENPTQAVQELLDANFLMIIEFQSEKYYFPVIEVGFIVFSPEYIYSILIDQIKKGSEDHPQLFTYLSMLTEENPFFPLN